MNERYGISDEQIARLRSAEEHVDAIKKEVSRTFLANFGLKMGDLVEDTRSGLQYRIDWCSVWFNFGRSNEPNVSMTGKRVWKSGRKAGREAHTISFLSPSSIKKVEA